MTRTHPANPWGRADLMALAAVRYCLWRRSYIVSDCVEWLIHTWPHLNWNVRHTIVLDVETAFALDDEARANGDLHRPLGMDQDRAQWAIARAHVRRAHWHTFLAGAGRAERRLKWLPPIPVNVEDVDGLPATVRPVKKP